MPTTFRSILRDRARSALAFAVGFVTVAAVGLVVLPPLITADSGETSYEPTRAELLVERHDCWAGDGPEGVVPSRAVVTLPGERAEVVPADVGFGIWLEGDPGTLHAFCP